NGWLLYRHVRDELDRLMGDRLLAIATTVAGTIGSDRFSELAVFGPDSPEYEQVRAELAGIAASNDLDDITLLDHAGSTVFELSSTSTIGEPNALFALQPELQTALISGLPQASPLVRVTARGEPQYLKSGYAPIEDQRGSVVGAVVVQGGSAFFSVLPQLRTRATTSALVGLLVVLVLGVLFFRVLRSLVRLEDSLRSTAALAAIGQIAAVVAHEIKNPLAIIRSRAERVRSKIESGKDRDEILSWFETIPSEVDRLNEIVTSYLSLARPELSGDGRCEVRAVIEEIATLLRPDLERQSVELALELGPGSLEASIGARSLKQVLLNLVLNATQALDDEQPIRRVSIGADSHDAQVRIWVKDTGRGMTEEEIRRTLEPFYSTKPTGSGLGLTLVRSLVRGSGGDVRMKSRPGEGTQVSIHLPA
ncbi:MAG: ATP-binding protein, partial [Planctomycetes bacterium]|nr:ATP-binding protein [Planctomycetota bacterium]